MVRSYSEFVPSENVISMVLVRRLTWREYLIADLQPQQNGPTSVKARMYRLLSVGCMTYYSWRLLSPRTLSLFWIFIGISTINTIRMITERYWVRGVNFFLPFSPTRVQRMLNYTY